MARIATADARLAAVAVAQQGAFTRAQATAAGFSAGQCDRRLRAGTWVRVLPRVYRHAATPPTAVLAHWAAVLWAGPGAVLSHTSAGALWQLAPVRLREPEVTVVKTRAPAAAGVIVHRTNHLDAADVGRVGALPVTAPARTLLDLAAVLGERDLRAAIDRARARRLAVPAEVVARLAAVGTAGRPGAARLRKALALHIHQTV